MISYILFDGTAEIPLNTKWKLKFNVIISFTDGKYHMTPDGELLVLNVTPADGHSRFQCRTLHTLTGSSKLSQTPAKIIISGQFYTRFCAQHSLLK